MSSAVVMDRGLFKRGMQAMQKEYNTSAAGVMRRQMSIASGQLARRYPPHSDKMGSKKNSPKAGKRAIENDMLKLFVPMPKEDWEDLREWQDDYRGTRDVFDYEGKKIKSWHESHMNQQRNRVTKSVTGNWQGYGRRFSNKMHVKQSQLKKYVSEISKSVGTLAGAWTKGTIKWKGSAGMPTWLSKNSQNGQALDRMGSNGSGYLEIRNTVQGANRWKRIDAFVMQSRTRGFQKELKAAVRKANKAGNKVR